MAEVVELLALHGADAKLLAGGQSFTPMLNLRLARPDHVIDIGRVPGLSYLRGDREGLAVGAMVRHVQFERYPAALPGFEVLRETAPLIGHYPIRTRGTIGGSLAHADAAAEWCMLALLLDAELVVHSVRGTRTLPVEGFFHGLYTTALDEDELIVEVRFRRPRTHAALEEFARRHGDFAIATVAVAFDLSEERIRDPRVVLGGVASSVIRCAAAEAALDGQTMTSSSFEAAGAAAAASIDPPADQHASADLRRRLTANLLVRAATRAAEVRQEGYARV